MLEHVGPRYRQIWRTAAVVLATIGVAASLIFVPPVTNLVAFLLSAVTIGAVCLSLGLPSESPSADLARAGPRWAGLGGLTVLAICGYAASVGAQTLLLLALVAATSPPVVVRLWSLPQSVPEPQPEQESSPILDDEATIEELIIVEPAVRSLSDEELCLAWRRSFLQLQSSVDGAQRLGLADVRRACLDELERRQPEAFTAWLASGPRAAGDPAKFFVHRAEHHD